MSENAPAGTKNDIKVIRRQNIAVFCVKVIPSSSRTSFAGVQNGILRVKLSAAPQKGKANQALVDFLADKLGIKKKFIMITSGLFSRVKRITVEQITPEILIEKLRSVLRQESQGL
jgi:uncharacterized protein YggU (UPF0235/DUF167 family)